MRFLLIRALCGSVLLLLGLRLAAATPAARYSVTDLGEASMVIGIDRHSPAVLRISLVGGKQVSALVTTTAEDLGLLPDGVFLLGRGVHRGRATGYASTGRDGGRSHAFLFDLTAPQGTRLRDLGAAWGQDRFSAGTGLNAMDVVGYGSDPQGEPRVLPLRFPGGGTVELLATLGGTSGFAQAVNEAGDIVGATRTAAGVLHATLWPQATRAMPQDLHTLPTAAFSIATDVNEAPQVVGSVVLQGLLQGFVWSTAQGMQTLPPLSGGRRSEVKSLNTAGDMVGLSDTLADLPAGQFSTSAVIWGTDRVPIDLQSRLVDGAGVRLERAVGINEAGQIACLALIGGQRHAVRLTPVP